METKEICQRLNQFVDEINVGGKHRVNLSLFSEAADRLEELEREKENIIHYNADLNNQLNKAEYHIEKLQKQLSEQQPEWISVKDRLPELGAKVLGVNRETGKVNSYTFSIMV